MHLCAVILLHNMLTYCNLTEYAQLRDFDFTGVRVGTQLSNDIIMFCLTGVASNRVIECNAKQHNHLFTPLPTVQLELGLRSCNAIVWFEFLQGQADVQPRSRQSDMQGRMPRSQKK